MTAASLYPLPAAFEAGVRVIAVLAPIAALLATAALCSARVRSQFGRAGYTFTLALYLLVPVAIRAAG